MNQYLFIFDTNFLLSLKELDSLEILEKIQEIFNFYDNIDYIALDDILHEISKMSKKEKNFIQSCIKFSPSEVTKDQVKKHKRYDSEHARCFNKNEQIDFLFILTAINYDKNNRGKRILIVTDDAGIHKYVDTAIPNDNISVTWNHMFLHFLAGQDFENFRTKEIQSIAKKQHSKINQYRTKDNRTMIYEKTEFYLPTAPLMFESFSQDAIKIKKLLFEPDLEKYTPEFITKVVDFFKELEKEMNLGDIINIEKILDSLFDYLTEMKIYFRESFRVIISPYLAQIYVHLSDLYQQKFWRKTGYYSALTRVMGELKYFEDNKLKDTILVSLTWGHLEDKSNRVARHYFEQISDKQNEEVHLLSVLLDLLDTPEDELTIEQFQSISVEQWLNQEMFFRRSANNHMKHKIDTIIVKYEHTSGFQLSEKHLKIKDGDIHYDPELFFLQNEFVFFYLFKKTTKGYRVVSAYNDDLGTFDFYIPDAGIFRDLNIGDYFKMEDGFIKRIKKPKKGSSHKCDIYFEYMEIILTEREHLGKSRTTPISPDS